MKIGELAKITGCQSGTIRFYEKKGLLVNNERNDSNYRIYNMEDANKLRFIIHCRNHGFSLADIAKLLAYKTNPKSSCKFAHTLVSEKLDEVEKSLETLLVLKQELLKLRDDLKCENTGECEIIKNLESPDNCRTCQNFQKNIIGNAD